MNFKNCRVRFLVFDQNPLIEKLFFMGEKFDYGKKGKFLAFDQIYS
jgi:hypothetical protein